MPMQDIELRTSPMFPLHRLKQFEYSSKVVLRLDAQLLTEAIQRELWHGVRGKLT